MKHQDRGFHGYKDREGYKRYKRRFERLKRRINGLAENNGIYRSRNGVLMGVCRGVAEHFHFNVFWSRVLVFVLFLFTGVWPVGVLYIVAGLILKVEPVAPLQDENDHEFYDTYAHSRRSAFQRLKKKFENIERRIQRMEDTVTSREFDWK